MAKLYWGDSPTPETVKLIANGDGYTVAASREGKATVAALMVVDGDGGSDEALAERVIAPVNGAPAAADATATVVAGESVDIALGDRPRGRAADATRSSTPPSAGRCRCARSHSTRPRRT